jgi:hypothetical protein
MIQRELAHKSFRLFFWVDDKLISNLGIFPFVLYHSKNFKGLLNLNFNYLTYFVSFLLKHAVLEKFDFNLSIDCWQSLALNHFQILVHQLYGWFGSHYCFVDVCDWLHTVWTFSCFFGQ